MAISPQRLTVYLYSAHRAVIFAIAQLSCLKKDANIFHFNRDKIIPQHGKLSAVKVYDLVQNHATGVSIKDPVNVAMFCKNTSCVISFHYWYQVNQCLDLIFSNKRSFNTNQKHIYSIYNLHSIQGCTMNSVCKCQKTPWVSFAVGQQGV